MVAMLEAIKHFKSIVSHFHVLEILNKTTSTHLRTCQKWKFSKYHSFHFLKFLEHHRHYVQCCLVAFCVIFFRYASSCNDGDYSAIKDDWFKKCQCHVFFKYELVKLRAGVWVSQRENRKQHRADSNNDNYRK